VYKNERCLYIYIYINYYYCNSLLLFQYLPVTFNFSPISSQCFGLRSLVIIFVSLVPKRRHISHKLYQISFVHSTPNHVLTAAGVRPVCRLETNLVSFEPLDGSYWEKTRQADRVQCSRCVKQCSGPFLPRIFWEITRQTDRV
jgi:hypothetical protein